MALHTISYTVRAGISDYSASTHTLGIWVVRGEKLTREVAANALTSLFDEYKRLKKLGELNSTDMPKVNAIRGALYVIREAEMWPRSGEGPVMLITESTPGISVTHILQLASAQILSGG